MNQGWIRHATRNRIGVFREPCSTPAWIDQGRPDDRPARRGRGGDGDGCNPPPDDRASVSESAAAGPQRTVAIEALAELLGRSAGIVAVHRRDGSPFTDIVVHAFDDHRRGVIEAPEVLVLTHSRTLRAIMAFAMDPAAIGEASRRETMDRAALETPEFARRWRERPDVRRTVLAAGEGVVDLELIPQSSRGYRTSTVWTLRLTWADRSADGTVTAELPVEPAADGPRDRE